MEDVLEGAALVAARVGTFEGAAAGPDLAGELRFDGAGGVALGVSHDRFDPHDVVRQLDEKMGVDFGDGNGEDFVPTRPQLPEQGTSDDRAEL